MIFETAFNSSSQQKLTKQDMAGLMHTDGFIN